MQRIELEVSRREDTPKAGVLRREGRLPGVIYGAGGENVAIHVEEHTFSMLGLGSSGAHLIRLASPDSALSGGIALVKAVQVNPVTGIPLHVDFLRVDVNKPVEARVSLSFTGKAPGVVEGGILQPLRRELDVRALPDKLPEQIEVDVSALNIHDSIHIEELTLPEGVEAIFTENVTLVTVVPPVVEAEPTTEEEELAAAAEGAVEGETPAEGADAGGDADKKKED